MNLNIEAPNVITSKELAELVQDGQKIQIVCVKAAYKDKSFIKGQWVIRAVDDEHTSEQYLCSLGRDGGLRIRFIKSLNGVYSAMVEAGFEEIVLPTLEGQISDNRFKPTE